jgi:hypothetical protein
MHCAYCRTQLGYVHGHAACLRSGCPMFGVNQAECCSGETGECVPTSAVSVAPAVHDGVLQELGSGLQRGQRRS